MSGDKWFAGVGARATPWHVCVVMEYACARLQEDGWRLRSGGAPGADTWCHRGAPFGAEIFRPEDCTPEALELSAKFHPAWHLCTVDDQLKHGRNAMVVLGRDLVTPVRFLTCWTPGGEEVGGTGQAIRIARAYDVPIWNYWWGDFPGADRIREQGRLF